MLFACKTGKGKGKVSASAYLFCIRLSYYVSPCDCPTHLVVLRQILHFIPVNSYFKAVTCGLTICIYKCGNYQITLKKKKTTICYNNNYSFINHIYKSYNRYEQLDHTKRKK